MSADRLAAEEVAWLGELAGMLAPIQCPGEEVLQYEALARKGLAEKRWHPGWGEGWTVTPAGRARLAQLRQEKR